MNKPTRSKQSTGFSHPMPAEIVSPARLAIRAAAGTGKTYSLTRRYLQLVDRGVSPSEILATTFTRKAAAEIASRILGRVADAVLEEPLRRDLATFLERDELSGEQAETLLNLLVDHWPTLRVGTLDRFFTQMARSIGFEIGLPAGWRLLDPIEDADLREQAIAHLLKAQGPTLLTQLVRLLFKGESSRSIHEEVDSITKELHELWQNVPENAWQALPRATERSPAEVETILTAIEQVELHPGSQFKVRAAEMELARAALWKELAQSGLMKAMIDGKDKYYTPISEELRRAYEPLCEEVRAQRRNPLAHQNDATRQLLSAYDQQYQLQQYTAGRWRFSDVTRLLIDWDKGSDPSATRLGDVRHLLLDEFQDTSVAQWKVLLPLVQQCALSERGSVFIVGDPKQAIYGWRGGAAELMDRLDQAIPSLHREDLVESRRSSQVILDFVNDVFGTLKTNGIIQQKGYLQQAAERWLTRFVPHRSAYPDRPGYVAIHVAHQPSEDDESAPAETLARTADLVQQWQQESPGASIGILVRKNDAVSAMLGELTRRWIDASQEGGASIASNPAVGLILSWLTWLDHPADSASYFHVSRSIWAESLGLTPDPHQASEIAALARTSLLRLGYADTIEQWVDKLRPMLDDRASYRLRQLIELARTFDRSPTLRPTDFVRFVEQTRVEDAKTARVRVMNIHQSKGLEFDIVLLPQLHGRLRPLDPKIVIGSDDILNPPNVACRYVSESEQSLLTDPIQEAFREQLVREMTEQLSMLYVALTRARTALHLIIPAPSPRDRSIHATLAGIIQSALSIPFPTPAGQTVWESGNPAAHRSIPTDTAPPPSTTVLLQPREPARVRPLPRVLVSPSARASQTISIQERLALREASATRRGSLLHAWMKMVGWNDDGPWPVDAWRELAQRDFPQEPDVDNLIAELKQSLESPAIREGLSRPADEIDLWRERRFIVPSTEGIVSGTFDRVVLRGEAGKVTSVDLIDFKTDRLKDEKGIPIRAEHYRAQMVTYRDALASMLGIPQSAIRVELWFLTLGVRHAL